MVSARHAEVTDQELREERQVEADEYQAGGELGPPLRVKLPGDLRPPVVHPSEVAHDRATDHDVVEVRNDEVGIVNMDVEAHRGEEQPSQPADGEQADEPERIQHR